MPSTKRRHINQSSEACRPSMRKTRSQSKDSEGSHEFPSKTRAKEDFTNAAQVERKSKSCREKKGGDGDDVSNNHVKEPKKSVRGKRNGNKNNCQNGDDTEVKVKASRDQKDPVKKRKRSQKSQLEEAPQVETVEGDEKKKGEKRKREEGEAKIPTKKQKTEVPKKKVEVIQSDSDSDFEDVTPSSDLKEAEKLKVNDSVDQKFENVEGSNILEMLMTFEKGHAPVSSAGASQPKAEENDSDWEEVEEDASHSPQKEEQKQRNVEITLDAPSIMRKRKKKGQPDVMEWFRLQMNRFLRETQMELHKVHLLCLVSHGRHINQFCSDLTLQALCLSLVPVATVNLKPEKWDLQAMNKFMAWFNSVFQIKEESSDDSPEITEKRLVKCVQKRSVANVKELVMVYVAMIRSLGMDVRIMYSLQPTTFKAADLKPKKGSNSKEKSPNSDKETNKSSKASKAESPKPDSSNKKAALEEESRYFIKDPRKDSALKKKSSKEVKGKTTAKNERKRKCASKVNYNEDESDSEARPKRKSKGPTKKEQSSEEEFSSEDIEFRRLSTKLSRSPSVKNEASGCDWWAEVYLPSMKKWICVDCVRGRVNHPGEMEKLVTQPMAYVLGFDSDFAVKDLTRKYAKNWMSFTRKLRTDEEWWKASLLPFQSWKSEREALEDAEIEASLIKKPMPTSISDYKNHPLYALRRHLLKFEAIYPDTAVPVGYLKNKEPVYARECVKTLHSRQNWMKEARLVRLNEEPYKVVKARMTPRRAALYDGKSEPMLELFGYWQTEPYIPPPAHDGKVPRNEYGNVELFRPEMLPGGTVHLKGMPGLNRIARKLDIDCAAAMTGWSLHGGYNHPVMEGWVVCVEHKDALLAAWDEEQENIRQKELEKREKRILGNWARLTRGLLIRKRLKDRYDLKEPDHPEEKAAPKKGKKSSKSAPKGEKATDAEMSWPRNLQDQQEEKSKKKKDQGTPFPFEVEVM